MKRPARSQRRRRIHRRVRRKIQGTLQRPRLCIFRSLRHIYAAVIDDLNGHTLAAASTLKLDGKKLKTGGNVEAARKVGKAIAEKIKAKGVEQLIFDRGGYTYQGRVKAVAEAAREAGLKF